MSGASNENFIIGEQGDSSNYHYILRHDPTAQEADGNAGVNGGNSTSINLILLGDEDQAGDAVEDNDAELINIRSHIDYTMGGVDVRSMEQDNNLINFDDG